MHRIMLEVDLVDWVTGTICKVQNNENWNKAWLDTYFELGGKSEGSGKKSCPKNAARVLYQYGRIKGKIKPYKIFLFQDAKDTDSVNGIYALMAVEELKLNSNLDLKSLINSVHINFRKQFGSAPNTDQGAIALTYKLWKLDKIAYG